MFFWERIRTLKNAFGVRRRVRIASEPVSSSTQNHCKCCKKHMTHQKLECLSQTCWNLCKRSSNTCQNWWLYIQGGASGDLAVAKVCLLNWKVCSSCSKSDPKVSKKTPKVTREASKCSKIVQPDSFAPVIQFLLPLPFHVLSCALMASINNEKHAGPCVKLVPNPHPPGPADCVERFE